MKAKDVMTRAVHSVAPSSEVADVARVFIEHRISACPVLDDDGSLVGIISEADLVDRAQEHPVTRSSWWRRIFADSEIRVRAYIKAHGELARDFMTRDVVGVDVETPLHEVAATLRRHEIRRVPVLAGGRVVGIVSRSDLIRNLTEIPPDEQALRDDPELERALLAEIQAAGIRMAFLHLGVSNGVVHISGATETPAERRALRLAYKRVAKRNEIDEQVSVLPPAIRSLLWAE